MEDLQKEIMEIIKETARFDFPFCAKEEKKKELLQDKKIYVENRLRRLAPQSFPDDEEKERIWTESVEYADEQFMGLPEKRRLNGFYLQELMHCYAEKLGKCIISNE